MQALLVACSKIQGNNHQGSQRLQVPKKVGEEKLEITIWKAFSRSVCVRACMCEIYLLKEKNF